MCYEHRISCAYLACVTWYEALFRDYSCCGSDWERDQNCLELGWVLLLILLWLADSLAIWNIFILFFFPSLSEMMILIVVACTKCSVTHPISGQTGEGVFIQIVSWHEKIPGPKKSCWESDIDRECYHTFVCLLFKALFCKWK